MLDVFLLWQKYDHSWPLMTLSWFVTCQLHLYISESLYRHRLLLLLPQRNPIFLLQTVINIFITSSLIHTLLAISNDRLFQIQYSTLTHWGRVTHICVGKLNIIGSDNGLSPGRRQTIIWTNIGILLFGPLGTNFSEILIGIQTFSLKKMHLKMSSAKWRPFYLGLNVLSVHWTLWDLAYIYHVR